MRPIGAELSYFRPANLRLARPVVRPRLVPRILGLPIWLTLAICVAVLIARRPDAFQHPQFWAEDGTVFYREAYLTGPKALFTPYAGYWHAVPRLVAGAALAADPRWVPAVFLACALGITLYVAALTQSERLPFPRHIGYALAIVAIPDSFETLLSVCNLQWILAAGLLLLLVFREPRNRAEHIFDCGHGIVLGLTGPFSLFFAPLFWARAWIRRSRASTALAVVVTSCGALQGWQIAHFPMPPATPSNLAGDSLRVVGLRVGACLLTGLQSPDGWPRAWQAVFGMLTLAGVALLAFRRGRVRWGRLGWGVAFVIITAAGLYRCRSGLPGMCYAGAGSRYFYLPRLVVLWLLIAATGDRRRPVRWVALALISWCALVNLPRLREAYSLPDLHWAKFAPSLRAGQAIDIPVNPPGWTLHLPARRG